MAKTREQMLREWQSRRSSVAGQQPVLSTSTNNNADAGRGGGRAGSKLNPSNNSSDVGKENSSTKRAAPSTGRSPSLLPQVRLQERNKGGSDTS